VQDEAGSQERPADPGTDPASGHDGYATLRSKRIHVCTLYGSDLAADADAQEQRRLPISLSKGLGHPAFALFFRRSPQANGRHGKAKLRAHDIHNISTSTGTRSLVLQRC